MASSTKSPFLSGVQYPKSSGKRASLLSSLPFGSATNMTFGQKALAYFLLVVLFPITIYFLLGKALFWFIDVFSGAVDRHWRFFRLPISQNIHNCHLYQNATFADAALWPFVLLKNSLLLLRLPLYLIWIALWFLIMFIMIVLDFCHKILRMMWTTLSRF